MNKKEWVLLGIAVVVCIVLIGIACVYFFPYRTAKVDWNMHGYLVTADGEVKGELEFSVKGKIRDYNDKAEDDRLWLDFTFPDSLSYRICRPTDPEYFRSNFQRSHDVPYYVCHVELLDFTDEIDVKFVRCAFAIDTIQEYIIMQFEDGSGQYLVASQNSNATAKEILEHFQDFIGSYIWA